jgi:hypothetical protein
MNINERFNRLDTFIAEDRLIRKAWGDGQECACLLLALAPEIGTSGAVYRCPASVLPPWLAHLTPSLDDAGSTAAWPTMVRRYSRVVRRGAETLDDAGWRRVLARTMLAVLAVVAPHDLSESCARVSALWGRVLAGDEPTEEEWAAASEDAEAALAALWAARASQRMGVGAASEAAARAAWVMGVAAGAHQATWDRITTALLDGIELECDRAEATK